MSRALQPNHVIAMSASPGSCSEIAVDGRVSSDLWLAAGRASLQLICVHGRAAALARGLLLLLRFRQSVLERLGRDRGELVQDGAEQRTDSLQFTSHTIQGILDMCCT